MDRKEAFDRHYFNGGAKVGGYAYEGYWDYPVHWVTFDKIMALRPESVLEVGCARGYLVKRFQDTGVPAAGLEISRHCILTRVANRITEWDICETPWPYRDGEFDLCVSVAVLEHVPEEHLSAVLGEMGRVSRRGLHGIDLGENDDGFDKTHTTLHPLQWWKERLPPGQRGVDKEELERGNVQASLPTPDAKVKLNLGSSIAMFHHGWINMDVVPLENFATRHLYKFFCWDVSKGLPIHNDCVDLLYCGHLLDKLAPDEGLALLRECHRIMKTGATLRVVVADLNKLIGMYQSGTLGLLDELDESLQTSPTQAEKLRTLMCAKRRTAYDADSLSAVGKRAGFTSMAEKRFRQGDSQIIKETLDSLPELSLYFEFYKTLN